MTNFGHVFLQVTRPFVPRLSFLLHVIVMQEIDGVLLHVAALMVVSDNHADIFVPGHALHLAVGEPQT